MTNFVIPDALKNFTTFVIHSPIELGKVDLAVCTTEGYLLELSHGIIANSCYTGICDGRDGCLYYQYQDDGSYNTFYVVHGENGDLVVVAKNDTNLTIVDRRHGIHSFRIADPGHTGQPKLLIYSSPNNYEVFGERDKEMLEISESLNNESVAKCIPIALQDLYNQHDLLKKELMFKKALIRRRLSGDNSSDDFSLPLISKTIDLGEAIKHVGERQPLLLITDTWERITGNQWVTALRIKNSSNRTVEQLTVICESNQVKEYQWTRVQPIDSSTFLIIIAVAIPDNLGKIGQIQSQFEVRYADGVITSPEFRLTSKKVVSGDLELFRSGNFAEDFPCLQLTHVTCDVTVSQAITPAYPFTDTLKTDLNLRELTHWTTPDSVYLTTECLQFSGLLIHQRILSSTKLNFKIYARTQDQLLIFVRALKETAPYGTTLELTS